MKLRLSIDGRGRAIANASLDAPEHLFRGVSAITPVSHGWAFVVENAWEEQTILTPDHVVG